MVTSKEREYSPTLMALALKVNLSKIMPMAKVPTNGRMANLTLAFGKITKWTVRVFFTGLMGDSTLDYTLKQKRMAME